MEKIKNSKPNKFWPPTWMLTFILFPLMLYRLTCLNWPPRPPISTCMHPSLPTSCAIQACLPATQAQLAYQLHTPSLPTSCASPACLPATQAQLASNQLLRPSLPTSYTRPACLLETAAAAAKTKQQAKQALQNMPVARERAHHINSTKETMVWNGCILSNSLK